MIDHPDSLGGPAFDPADFLPGSRPNRRKGGSVPKVNKARERQQDELLRLQLAQAKQKVKPVHIPQPEPIEPPPPPPTQTSADVQQAATDQRRQALKRTNQRRGTLFGGETGGFRPGALGGQNPTLLG